MDLGDLNIVSITPSPKVAHPTNTTKKKNNKYERRRQKAANAKRQKQHSPILKNKIPKNAENDSPELNKQGVDSIEKTSPAKDSDDKNEELTEEVDVNSRPIEIERIEPSFHRTVQDQRTTDHHHLTEEKESSPISRGGKGSRRRPQKERAGGGDQAEDDDGGEQHANYMAEYHARPMELDRRSGARTSKVISRESKHLFTKDQKDWTSLDLNPRLIQTLDTKFHLIQPTSVQSRAIQTFHDPMNKQKNFLIHSETGSGKTLAYLLPILQKICFSESGTTLKLSRKDVGTRCIILCPTRELASQTLTVLETICQANFAGWMVPGGLSGGDSRNSEKARVRKGLGIIVATPGRLLDHLNKTESLLMNLKGKLQWLVLDEADRLLDMGLGDQVKQIVQLIRANEASKLQPWWRSVLVSATVTDSVQALAKERMLCGDQPWVWVKAADEKSLKRKNGVGDSTTVSKDNDTNEGENSTTTPHTESGYSDSTPRQLAQFHVTVTAKLRLSTLVSFLVQRVSQGDRTVVFLGTCACVDFHHKLFQSMESLWSSVENKDDDDTEKSKKNGGLFGDKAQVFKLHGSIQHSKRNQTLKLFEQANKGAILLTTDVSARGLNLEGVDWTVQYDPPCEIADYVHRVGRVARAGKAGHSLLFLLPSEKGYLDVLQTKGISNLEPLALSAILNKAASLCPDWTNSGLKFGGNKEISSRSTGNDNVQRGSRHGEYFASEVQRRLEECIVQDNATALSKWKEEKKVNKKRRQDTAPSKSKEGELIELARDAFLSFLRAYAAKREAAVRSIFSARALHVGHIARSFALKDPPKSLISKHKQNQKAISDMEALDKEANRPKALQFNEYENNSVSLADLDNDEDGDNDDAMKSSNEFDFHKERPPKKRPKFNTSSDVSRIQNAKALLLQNAMKMQTNLMDAM